MRPSNGMNPRIILSGGGTAGSVTPLLAVAEVLRQRGADILFVGSADGPEQQLVNAAGLAWRSIAAGKLRRYASWKNLADVRQVLAGYTAAKRIMTDWRPDVVVSAGSYISVPLAWAAKRRGIPVLIHQQDIQPGLANRFMTPTAAVITTAFAVSKKYFPPGKTFVTGNPIRSGILQGSRPAGIERFGLDRHRPVLLILGGGTGAAVLNQLVIDSLPALAQRWQVIHVTGQHRGSAILAQKNYHPFAFLTDDLPQAMAVADLVVTRAGLGTLSELMAWGKPIIVIPMPDTHQERNAQFITDERAGLVLNQPTLTPASLVTAINDLWSDQAHRESLSGRLHQLHQPDAAADMAERILHLTHR